MSTAVQVDAITAAAATRKHTAAAAKKNAHAHTMKGQRETFGNVSRRA